jgi:hypothetical protein
MMLDQKLDSFRNEINWILGIETIDMKQNDKKTIILLVPLFLLISYKY